MKNEIIPSLLLTMLCVILFSGVYSGIVWGIAQIAPGKGEGKMISSRTGKQYYENVGQSFTRDDYFWSRPSAVGYNAAGSGGSNKGPSNPDYLKQVSDRIDTFLIHNPRVDRSSIPSDMVTASGSGLDPHISREAAIVQIKRVATARAVNTGKIEELVKKYTNMPYFGMGPERVNVLELNLALDELTTSEK